MHTRTAAIVVAAGILSVAPVAHADVLVSNLDLYSGFTMAFSGFNTINTVLAAKFTTGADPVEVFNATLPMGNGNGHPTSSYRVFIYTSAGSTPDALVGTFDTAGVLAPGTSPTDVTFESINGIALDAGTDYWLAAKNTTGNYLGWAATYYNTESSSLGWTIDDSAVAVSNDAAGTWLDRSGFYNGDIPQFSLGGNVIPAPGALALLGIGGLVSARRRRN